MSPAEVLGLLKARGLLLATGNSGKLLELRRALNPLDIEVLAPADVQLSDFDVVEDRDTLAGNAEKKAREYAQASGLPALADDSGLFVDALNGGPGVYSARFGGPGLDDAGRRSHLLSELQAVPPDQRGAEFRCVLVLAVRGPDDRLQCLEFSGVARGSILTAARGEAGFGYDPVFLDPHSDLSFAELDPGQKDARSHRGFALRDFVRFLRT